MGIEFFFSGINVIYDALSLSESESHPSPMTRRMLLYEMLKKEITEDVFNSVFELGKKINYILNEIWLINKNTFFETLNKNKKA